MKLLKVSDGISNRLSLIPDIHEFKQYDKRARMEERIFTIKLNIGRGIRFIYCYNISELFSNLFKQSGFKLKFSKRNQLSDTRKIIVISEEWVEFICKVI